MPDEGPTEGIEVRPARSSDARAFLEAYRRVAAERTFIQTERVTGSARAYRKRFRRSWTETETNLVAVAGGRVVGSLGMTRDHHPATRHVATLGMFVDRAWRSKGVGTALLAEGIRWAREHGIERIELTVYPHNDAAVALYRKFGFAVEGRLVRHAKKSYGYEDELLMAVWLGPEIDEGTME